MVQSNFIYKEVLPVEIPLNYSNQMLKEINYSDFNIKYLKSYSIPFVFVVPKTNGLENRQLSLTHPLAQLQMMGFIDKYKYNIMNFCSLSPYSIRSPQKLNNLNFSFDRLFKSRIIFYNSLFSENKTDNLLINKTDLEIEFQSFFSYKKYNNILQFKNSIQYHRTKLRFDNYMSLDIRNFFSSIYTHSLEWAVTGSIKRTKQELMLKGDDNLFRKIIDTVCQRINYNETNGIVVGPEFSRIISEILLTRIDLEIASKLKEQKLNYNVDYIIYRFIDDYTIFFNNPSEQNEEIIKDVITDVLMQYKLQLNTEKHKVSKVLELVEDTSVIDLKEFLSNFNQDFNKAFRFDRKNSLISGFMVGFTKIIIESPSKKVSIVRYALKKISELIEKNLQKHTRQLVLDLAFFILSFSPEHFSVQTFNSLIFKYREHIKLEPDVSLKDFDTEVISRLIKFLKRNANSIDQIYELLAMGKFLTEKLPASLLCALLDVKKFKFNYFIKCAISNYILDENNSYQIYSKYQSVCKKVTKQLKDIITDQTDNPSRFLDSNYFYIINDFSHYPFFKKANKKNQAIYDLLINEKNHFVTAVEQHISQPFGVTGKDNIKKFANVILGTSYYRWNLSYSKYVKVNILKSLNSFKNNPNTFRYG